MTALKPPSMLIAHAKFTATGAVWPRPLEGFVYVQHWATEAGDEHPTGITWSFHGLAQTTAEIDGLLAQHGFRRTSGWGRSVPGWQVCAVELVL